MADGSGAHVLARELITKTECARRFGLTLGRVCQMTVPGAALYEAMQGKMVDWERAVQLRNARADGARCQPAPLGAQIAPPAYAPADNVVTITEDDRRFKQARARKMEADADAAEADRLDRLAELVGRAAAEAEFFSLARALRDQLMMLPSALAEDLAVLSDPREVRAVLHRRLRETLTDIVGRAFQGEVAQ